MTDHSFSKFVPGFEFLQGLVKNAGAALPGFNQWVAPTINPQELEKRIEELRTVQFWLEQNARMLAATIQALEVQRMTLSTLHAMNVPMADLSSVLKTPTTVPPSATAASAQARAAASDKPDSAEKPETPETPETPRTPRTPKTPDTADAAAATGTSEQPRSAAAAAVDPMQWWTALTQQFTQLAANAMKDPATEAAQFSASTMMKQGFDAVGETLRKAAAMPGEMMSQAGAAAPSRSDTTKTNKTTQAAKSARTATKAGTASAKVSGRASDKAAPTAARTSPPKPTGRAAAAPVDKPGRPPSRSSRRST